MHPAFLEFLDMARAKKEIARVSISTNGLRCASDYRFCEELARRKVYVSLQLDALSNPALRALRGAGDQRAAREKALTNLERAGVRTTIVSTVAKGVNDDRIGECIDLLYQRDFILSLTFQPAAFTGYGGEHFAPHDPMNVVTIPDIVRGAVEQTGGRLTKSDFLPLPCSHPSCFGLTYLLKTQDREGKTDFIPFPRFLELERYLEILSNRGTIRPDDQFEGAIKETIDEMWTSAGQVPDQDKIMKALRRAIFLMYPEDRALALEERLHVGESLVKTIFIHAFMDVHTFEVDRIKKCCTHYALPDGRLMPGCAYNMFYRHKDPRFAGATGTPMVWGKA
jgi:tetraether lipid synthase